MYVSIAISALLLFLVFSKKIRFRVFIIYQLIVTFILNIHYFIDGPASRIAFFIAIYDPLHNLGREGDVPALQKCVEGDDCSAWSDSFDYHASWGVSFYRRLVFFLIFDSFLFVGSFEKRGGGERRRRRKKKKKKRNFQNRNDLNFFFF